MFLTFKLLRKVAITSSEKFDFLKHLVENIQDLPDESDTTQKTSPKKRKIPTNRKSSLESAKKAQKKTTHSVPVVAENSCSSIPGPEFVSDEKNAQFLNESTNDLLNPPSEDEDWDAPEEHAL